MKKAMFLFFLTTLFIVAAGTVMGQERFEKYQPKKTSRVREATEWSTTYTFSALDEKTPRVLLIGDSICNGYQAAVQEKLGGKMNVTFWASSKCVTDPNYFRELDLILSGYHYDVISFNNGLHSLDTDRAEWAKAYEGVIDFIRDACPDARLMITNATPLKDPSLTAKSHELNGIAEKIAMERGIPVIDLFSAMDPLDRDEYWNDTYHFKPAAIEIQAGTLVAAFLKEI